MINVMSKRDWIVWVIGAQNSLSGSSTPYFRIRILSTSATSFGFSI